jgi:cytoskeleton protein RodZ
MVREQRPRFRPGAPSGLRLTLWDWSAYSPLRDPTLNFRERPPCRPLGGGTWIVEDRFRFMARGNFGERLKRERELREVSMDELTKATRISTRFVEALENEDWARLPGGVFGHGFVRTIARYLGLNEEALLGEYDLARADHLAAAPPRLEERIPSPPKWLPVAAVLLLLLFIVGLFYAGRYAWHRYAASRASKKSAAASAPTEPQLHFDPSSRGAGEQFSSAASSKAPLDLSVSTSAPTRVRVLADDKLMLDIELPAGETRHFSANDHFEVTAGDSSAVLLELNHKAMPPLGAPGASGRIVLSEKDLRP